MNSGDYESLWGRLAEFLAANTGLQFGPERREDLRRAMVGAAQEFGFAAPEEYAEWLLSAQLTKQQTDALAGRLTVGETYFFRHHRSFEALETEILPELLAARRRAVRFLRIWSAGCCTGEEPYSLAILLTRLIPDWREWQITLLATDVNGRFLEQAAAGVFRDWSFRESPPAVRENYFRGLGGGRYEILPHLRQMVSFACLNLATDPYPSLFNNTNAMDVILCRNVLMYFAAAQAARVVSQLEKCLVPGGWLMCSPADSLTLAPSELQMVNFSGATAYRRPAAVAPFAPVLDHRPALRSEQPVRATAVAPAERVKDQQNEPAAEPPGDGYAEAASFYEQGHYAEAADCLQRLVARRPDDAAVLGLLARVHADQGRLAEAAAWSQQAIAADRLNPHKHYLLATILQEQGSRDAAVECLHRALYLEPGFVLAHFALAGLLREQCDTAAARKHLRQALRVLDGCRPDDLVPESDGVTAARFREMICAVLPFYSLAEVER